MVQHGPNHQNETSTGPPGMLQTLLPWARAEDCSPTASPLDGVAASEDAYPAPLPMVTGQQGHPTTQAALCPLPTWQQPEGICGQA